MSHLEMDINNVLNEDQNQNLEEQLLTFEENEHLGDANLVNPLSPQSENFILYGSQQLPRNDERSEQPSPNFQPTPVGASLDSTAPDPIEVQNTLERMVGMESYIAKLEAEIGRLKEKREPTEEILHRTKRGIEGQRGNEGQQFLQVGGGGVGQGMGRDGRGMDRGRGGGQDGWGMDRGRGGG